MINENLDILKSFEPISLKEMDSVKLMNRTDTKFMFNRSYLEEIISEVLDNYRILDIDGHRLSHYRSLYYDTDAMRLYLLHQNGKLNRYKIRHRTYVDSKIGFLEVKFKSNKGRTIKERIKEPVVPQSWSREDFLFLKEKLPFEPGILKPTLWVNYSRLTLVNKNSPERLTIDLGLEFIFNHRTVNLDDLVIAEVKQEKRKMSPFMKVMKKYHLRSGGISKYCLGLSLTHEGLKKNNFKKKLLRLKHILNDRHTTSAE